MYNPSLCQQHGYPCNQFICTRAWQSYKMLYYNICQTLRSDKLFPLHTYYHIMLHKALQVSDVIIRLNFIWCFSQLILWGKSLDVVNCNYFRHITIQVFIWPTVLQNRFEGMTTALDMQKKSSKATCSGLHKLQKTPTYATIWKRW